MAKFELSDEAKAAGLKIGRNENILQADRDAALGNEDSKLRTKMKSEKYNSPSVVDKYRDYDKNPEAKAFPVAAPRQLDTFVENMPEENEAKPKETLPNSRLKNMVERLGGSRVGFIPPDISNRKGGVIKMAKGGSVKSSASRRADGCATKGKTKGRMV